ncbi:hypothetical protein BV22DRAFT_1031532 [Leucogyrophana mollusca]|uniref:Uncharacterized protein n=1 Tax=Leucogyrophana mollusca TaxID=85980 RepID=A0ACB8BR36_9AGAM|nr:hypothetical protein BV22DRAFT_1031532 [Leucogyrophana mollusca]
MSSSDGSSLPSPAELENLGVLFVGFVAATVLYGLTFFQTYIYYSRYPKDTLWIKILVGVLCFLDTASSALVSQVLYYYLIVMFTANMDTLYATTTFCVQNLLSIILAFISQLFFATRVYTVSGRSKLIALTVSIFSFVSLVFGLGMAGQMFHERRLSALASPHMEAIAAINQSFASLADLLILGVMCHYLQPKRYPEMLRPEGWLETSVTLLVSRGLGFTVIQLAYFTVFIALPSKQIWVPFQMVACKFYVNTVLGLLNAREVKHGYGINEEDSLSDRKEDSSESRGGMPSAIRFAVMDTKATRKSLNLTQQMDESGSTGIEETQKRYRDDETSHNDSIHSVPDKASLS